MASGEPPAAVDGLPPAPSCCMTGRDRRSAGEANEMRNSGTVKPAVAVAGTTRTAALIALLLGAFFVLGAGFAPIEAIHDAAHDGRHSFAFPCH